MSDVELKRFEWAAVCVGRGVEAVWGGRLCVSDGELNRFEWAAVVTWWRVEAV